MRTLSTFVAALLLGATPVMAQSQWLESGRLDPSEVRALCEQASDVRELARSQMISTGNERWLRLSRRRLVVEAFVMGTPPLDPGRCYVVARAGFTEETERRVFEVRDFAVGDAGTTVFLVGRDYALAAETAQPSR